MIDLLMI